MGEKPSGPEERGRPERKEDRPVVTADELLSGIENELPSPEAMRRYTTEYHQVSFPIEYLDKPEEVPLDKVALHLTTQFTDTSGRSHYGGPGSKYADRGNEDGMFAAVRRADGALVVSVTDGAGGSKRGLDSSRAINDMLLYGLVRGAEIREAFKAADRHSRNKTTEGYSCALAAVVMPDGRVTIGWAGDVKAMTLRGDKKLAEGTTKMHNLAALFMDQPSDYYRRVNLQSKLTSSLGGKKGQDFKYGELQFPAVKGDRIVIASDGFWDIVSEYEVEQLAIQHQGTKLQEELFKLAYQRNQAEEFTITVGSKSGRGKPKPVKMRDHYGYGDNITILVVDLHQSHHSNEAT